MAARLGSAGLPVVVVDPAQVRAFARFALATRPPVRPLADAATSAPADPIKRADHSDDRGRRAA